MHSGGLHLQSNLGVEFRFWLQSAYLRILFRFTRLLVEKANGMELLASRRKVVQQLNNLMHTMPALGIHVSIQRFVWPRAEENIHFKKKSLFFRWSSNSSHRSRRFSSNNLSRHVELSLVCCNLLNWNLLITFYIFCLQVFVVTCFC